MQHLYQKKLIFLLYLEVKNILEIAPGSGYLSLLLAMSNFKVASVDITQALTLWQKNLYEEFGVLNESVFDLRTGKILQIPWWNYKRMYHTKFGVEIALVIINHAICELHPIALRYFFEVCTNFNVQKIIMERPGTSHFLKI